MGLFANATWQERTVPLNPGDLIIAYTDGVSEASGPSGEEWGVHGILKAATACGMQFADDLVRSVLESMDDFSGGVQTDDATVTVLRIL